MSWKEIEVKDVSELKPGGKYRVKVGETWLDVGNDGFAQSPTIGSLNLPTLIKCGCPIEVEVDEGPVWLERKVGLRVGQSCSYIQVPRKCESLVFHIIEKREGERVEVLKEGDVVLRAGEFRKVNTYTPGYCFEEGVSAYIVKDGGE
jgi:hypothetical protein